MLAKLKSWWRRLRGLRPTVKIQLSEELLALYNHLANREGLSLDEWVRKSLNSAVPRAELRRLERGALHAAGLELANIQLDEDERLTSSVVSYDERPATRKALPVVHGHPCAHLLPKYPMGYTPRDCQGTCSSTQDGFRGRVCQWASTVANNCAAFEPKPRDVRPGA